MLIYIHSGGGWWNQWVITASHCYSWGRRWSDTLWYFVSGTHNVTTALILAVFVFSLSKLIEDLFGFIPCFCQVALWSHWYTFLDFRSSYIGVPFNIFRARIFAISKVSYIWAVALSHFILLVFLPSSLVTFCCDMPMNRTFQIQVCTYLCTGSSLSRFLVALLTHLHKIYLEQCQICTLPVMSVYGCCYTIKPLIGMEGVWASRTYSNHESCNDAKWWNLELLNLFLSAAKSIWCCKASGTSYCWKRREKGNWGPQGASPQGMETQCKESALVDQFHVFFSWFSVDAIQSSGCLLSWKQKMALSDFSLLARLAGERTLITWQGLVLQIVYHDCK